MPTKYLDEEGLSHVVRRAKETFAEKKELWNWQKTEKAGAVAFEPVPDSVLEPVVEFKFKETLPAEGEKGPDNPSTIEGVSSATIWRTGKNLRIGGKTEGTYTQNGLTYTYNSDGTITFNGTATEGTFFYLNGGETRIPTKANFTYILSGCPSGGSQDTYSLSCTSPFNGSTVYAIDRGNGFIINKSQDMSWDMYIYINSGITVSNLTFKPQIEIGSIATDYEPPILPSEAIHTFSLGNTYYGGSVDIASGAMTVTHLGFAFDGTEEWRTIGNVGAESDTFRHDLINSSFPELRRHVGWPTCSHFLTRTDTGSLRAYLSGVFQENTWFFVVVDTNAIYNTNETWKAFLATQYANGTPVTIAYQLETPFEVQLDPIQIKSLASLDKYEPRINTIYTDAEFIQVGYQKFTAEGNFVHTTGNETIDGIKTIANTRPAATAGETVTSLYIRNPEVTRGVPHPTGKSWTQMLFLDANGEPETTQAGRLGMFELVSPTSVNSSTSEYMQFSCYKYTNEQSTFASLRVGYDTSGNPYASAPSTSSERAGNTDIVTRDWLPKDERLPQKADLWNWQKTKKESIVSFYPIAETKLETTLNFIFKETPPASGEKGPDNPSTITGISSLLYGMRGKNLIRTMEDNTSNDTWNRINDVYTLNDFTNSSTGASIWLYPCFANYPIPKGTYTLSINNSKAASGIRVSLRGTNGDWSTSTGVIGRDFYLTTANKVQKVVLPEGNLNARIYISVPSGVNYKGLTLKPQLELGDTATEYERPMDLPDYLIDLNSTYYGGSIDINSGIMTVTQRIVVFDGTEDWFESIYSVAGTTTTFQLNTLWKRDTSTLETMACTHFPRTSGDLRTPNTCWQWDNKPFFICLPGDVTVEDFKAWLASEHAAGHPVMFTSSLKDPETVQLSTTQLASLFQADKYIPQMNSVYTNANSVEVGYQRYVDEEKLVARDWCITNDEIDEISF